MTLAKTWPHLPGENAAAWPYVPGDLQPCGSPSSHHIYPLMALHEVLADKRTEVLRHWKAQVQGVLTPDSMPTFELVDHIPGFVDEIVVALRADAGLPSIGPLPEESKIAGGHGLQRLRLGFSLDSVVREYGALRDSIVAISRDGGNRPSIRAF